MRHILPVALFVLLVQAAGACLAEAKPARHVEKAGGFSFVPPKDWAIKEFPGLKYKIAVGPAANGFAPNINAVDESFNGSLKEYVAASKQGLKGALKNFKEVSETEVKTDGSAPCIRLVAEDEQNGKKLRQSFYCFELAKGKMRVVTCSALAEGGEKLDSVFESAMKTLRAEKPK